MPVGDELDESVEVESSCRTAAWSEDPFKMLEDGCTSPRPGVDVLSSNHPRFVPLVGADAGPVVKVQLLSSVSTASTRFTSGEGSRPSLRNSWAHAASTVRSLISSSPAMPALERPYAISARMSRSRCVR